MIAGSAGDHVVRIWQMDSGDELQVLKGQRMASTNIAFSHNSRSLASASRDKIVRTWETKTGNMVASIKLDGTPLRIAFSADDEWLAIGFAADAKSISLRRVATGEEALNIARDFGATEALRFSPKGNLLAAATGRVVQVWEISTKKGGLKKGVPDAEKR